MFPPDDIDVHPKWCFSIGGSLRALYKELGKKEPPTSLLIMFLRLSIVENILLFVWGYRLFCV
jgi:hypothetical protein